MASPITKAISKGAMHVKYNDTIPDHTQLAVNFVLSMCESCYWGPTAYCVLNGGAAIRFDTQEFLTTALEQ